jgi:hypothetical protein
LTEGTAIGIITRCHEEVDMATGTNALAEVFWLAFKNLDDETKDEVIRKIIADENLREELFDAALVEDRTGEPEKDFNEYLKETGV